MATLIYFAAPGKEGRAMALRVQEDLAAVRERWAADPHAPMPLTYHDGRVAVVNPAQIAYLLEAPG